MFKFTEDVYESNLPIRYVFEEANKNKDYLVVVFSGFNPPNAKLANSYNYIRTLRNIDCHRLFILDNYGPRGSYYLGSKDSNEVESSIVSLIQYISRKYNIKQENIITAGSSKGGSAALYYGLKYHFGYVIGGAPQTKIADYIKKNTIETFEYMLGNQPTDEEVNKLNNIIFKQLKEDCMTKIHLLTSENDIQYKPHILPFVEKLNKKKINYKLDINNRIENHNAIAVHFPLYLLSNLANIMYQINIKDLQLEKLDASHWILNTDYEMKQKKELEMKIVIRHQDNVIQEIPVQQKMDFQIDKLNITGAKVLEIFFVINLSGQNIVQIPMDSVFVFNGNVLQGTEFSIKDKTIFFRINIEDSPDLEYAFYIRRNNVVIEKLMYQRSNSISYKIKDPGNYQVHYFIRLKNGEKYSNRTKAIRVDFDS